MAKKRSHEEIENIDDVLQTKVVRLELVSGREM